jgi:phosphoribosylaminoimidazole-succinocarboxamide synthase
MATLLRDIYQELSSNPANSMLWKTHIWEGPAQTDIISWESQGFGVYQGKIRTVLSRDGRVQLLHSDRLTAFDRHIDYVPLKGVILTAISKFWLEEISKFVPTHYIKDLGPRALLTENLRPIKAEVVVRGYLAGSILRAYEKGERAFCGVSLPDGLKPYSRLPEPIITPTTKAAAFEHDEGISAEELMKRGVCSKDEWEKISTLALKVFSLGCQIYGEKGWILVDTKYEFGRGDTGVIKLIDEVHTPDSSRLWKMDSYETRLKSGQPPEMLDKENVRRWLLDQGFSGTGDVPAVPKTLLLDLARTYLQVAETLIGRPLSI